MNWVNVVFENRDDFPHITVKIKRPDGKIEVVELPEKLRQVSSRDAFEHRIYPNIVKQTKLAGKGEVLDFTYTEPVKIIAPPKNPTTCRRCGKVEKKLFSKDGFVKIGSQKVKVVDHYCSSCYQLLKVMGSKY